jgi:guanosine-3',5'-bis(diphosphate) 3'-pyrophosphohydrolase
MARYVINEELEKKEILKRYRNLLRVWTTRKEPEDKKLVRKAFDLALDAHKDMRRETGEPYIYHPLEVATIVAGEIGLGATAIVCALLHDVVEDTHYSLDDIKLRFGEKVKRIIDGLTKIEEIFDQSTTTKQAENFRKILLTLSDDVRIILIKLADRLHNMRTLDAMQSENQLKTASETIYLFAPLAHRLGLYAIKSELEDLALKFTDRDIYNTISSKLKATRQERNRFFSKFIYPIKKEMSEKGMKFTIQAREKSIFSIWQKMRIKELPFEEVYDLFAIRIIIDVPLETEKAESWRVYSIITDYYRPNQSRLKDWISIPKANGYEALHTTVMSNTGQWVEIQIRSHRMDEIAEKGYAAHWKYKETADSETGLEEWLNKLRELLSTNDSDALDFLSDVKLDLFADEIYVYTPKGDVKTLPTGATALDFAYAIHTDIGNKSIGAKVNHALVTLDDKLKSGDQVEIISSESQAPKEEWLDFVVTAKAKSNIKQAIRDEKKKLYKQGQVKLEGYFNQFNLDNSRATVQKFMDFQNIKSLVDLFYLTAKDEIVLNDVRSFNQEGERRNWFSYLSRPFTRNREVNSKNLTETILEKLKNSPESLLLGDDISDIKYTIMHCCNPIPGDDVVGFLTDHNTIEIHRTNCPLAIDLMSRYGNRIIKTKWNNKESVGFLTGIKIKGVDKKGLIRKITDVISEKHNINIRSFHLDTSAGMTEGTIMIYVHDTNSLNKLIDNLKNLKEIIKISRIDRID